ncbi:sulfur carrier protein ThiS [Pullulanibacillus sp. KACC 23026]|uniref:sulfur carrier protein ThiS n=1 Tax=Pullulanibacillus sp. KACC 23026 TaxID=3028315 RepID=UPI0023AED8F3|nr:sulfur carrier protein ThiS [Pullulanibacillus sp. KACC 23026]WEG13330.1 sulfur carrier protein ThiS [Pullulanibacillus sp. KACC 23026]
MKLTINGRLLALPETVSKVSDLLSHLGLENKVTVVEVNHEIIEKGKQAEQNLTDGDRVEIVHFVGGG